MDSAWLGGQVASFLVGLLTTGVWALGAMLLYRRERHAKELLAWFALRGADQRILSNLGAAAGLLRSFEDGHADSKSGRRDVVADLSDMELRLTRNLAGLPAEWIMEHLPFRDESGVVWANDIHFVTNGIRELIDALGGMRRDLEKEALGKGDLARCAQPWVERTEELSVVVQRQLKKVPAEAAALDDA
jgi:hypothetical protein